MLANANELGGIIHSLPFFVTKLSFLNIFGIYCNTLARWDTVFQSLLHARHNFCSTFCGHRFQSCSSYLLIKNVAYQSRHASVLTD